jgi:hypothetical protein
MRRVEEGPRRLRLIEAAPEQDFGSQRVPTDGFPECVIDTDLWGIDPVQQEAPLRQLVESCYTHRLRGNTPIAPSSL